MRTAVRTAGPVAAATVPQAAIGSPFGPQLHGLVLYLKTYHAVSFARIEGLLKDLFGVKVSQGAISNMLKRSPHPFALKKDDIIQVLRRAEMVASDEIGVRIEGVNGYHWVFICYLAIMHEFQISLAKKVVLDMMGKHTPKPFLSDGYAAWARPCANIIKLVLLIWPEISPMGVEASTDLLCPELLGV